MKERSITMEAVNSSLEAVILKNFYLWLKTIQICWFNCGLNIG
jgi:hypothetical protein